MAFVKGQPRPATSGRRAGTPNKVTAAVREQLEQYKCNPVKALIDIVKDDKAEKPLRLRAASELMRYVFPQLRSVELRGPQGGPIEVTDVSPRELLRRRLAGIAARATEGADPQRIDGSASSDPAA